MLRRVVLCLALSAIAAPQAQTVPLYKQAGAPIDARVSDLLARMTLEEKFWQLFMIPGDLDNPANDYSHGIFGLQIRGQLAPGRAATGQPEEQKERDDPQDHAKRINAIQKYFVENTRLGIPIIPFEEAVHGLARPEATMFP